MKQGPRSSSSSSSSSGRRTAAWALTCATLGALGGLGAGLALGVDLRPSLAQAAPTQAKPAEPGFSRYDKLDALGRALALIEQRYVRPVDAEAIVGAAIGGMVSELDPHSAYLPPRDADLLREDLDGQFGGVGLVVSLVFGQPPYLDVREVIPGGPAERDGIRLGDRIVAIEGRPIRDFADLSEAIALMRGVPGTEVSFVIQREGRREARQVVRAVVEAEPVTTQIFEGPPGRFAAIRLREFSEGAANKVRGALRDAESGGQDRPLAGLVLDLRDNGGGLLNEAVDLVDLFVARGAIVRTRTRADRVVDEVFAVGPGTRRKLPLVVLINKGSASASEIVAGALQDHGRAAIVGERSYGKGSVQVPYELGDGSILKLTTALYYTPADRLIQARGIRPDLWVGVEAPAESDSRPGLPSEREVDGHLKPQDFGAEEEADLSAFEIPEDPQLQGALAQVLALSQMKARARRASRRAP